MALNPFLERFGFTLDPFESTDAENEPHLDDYFVAPPYFANVLGDARAPASHVVLAPRGGGKTAQRKTIEERSAQLGSFLCVTYDEFDQPAKFDSGDASLAYHLNQICRRILLGILVVLDEDPKLSEHLSEHQKQLLKFQLDRFLGSLSAAELEQAVKSLKNFGDKARDFWNKYAGPLRVLINALMAKLELDKVDLPEEVVEEAKQDEALTYHFQHLLEVARALGFESTYILVDRIDEMPITGDASSTFEFIWPLLADLRTLETNGVALKFFLWDQLGPLMIERKFRSDRIDVDKLAWTLDELEQMLQLRLRAYSDRRVSSFNELLCPDVGMDIHALLAHFANGSPRDMIRLANRIVAEETRTSVEGECITLKSVWAGLRAFSEKLALELIPESYLDDLRRVGKPTFTISHLSGNVFRIHENSARRKIQLWTDTGVISKVDEVPNPPNRPSYLYGVVDPRVAIAMLPSTEVDLILATQMLICPSCGGVAISDEAVVTCVKCSARSDVRDAANLLDTVAT